MAIFLNEVLPYDQVLDGDVRERLAVRALRAALLLGLAGDLLLRGGGLGVNALLYSVLVAATAWGLDRERGDGATQSRLVLLVPVVAAGVALAWRQVELLSVAAVGWFVLGVALHAAALRGGPAWNLWRLDPLAPFGAVLRLGGDAAVQSGLLIGRDVPQGTLTGVTGWRSVAAGWRGALAALPLLLLFNALFMSADPVWERQAQRVVDVDLVSTLGHVLFTMLLAWMAGGWLRGSLLAPPVPPVTHAASKPKTAADGVRSTDVLVPLHLVNLLFASFVAMQLRTLVGGAAYVKAVAGLTFAEYARHGFFQLVLVAALTLPALLAADALMPIDHVARRKVRRASFATLVLLGGILGSAAARMKLYLDAYSLTEDRFYASAAMVWLALVIVWFGATVLRERRERFIGGAMVSAFGMWALLVVANPDAIISNANLARLERDGRLDAGRPLGREGLPMDASYLGQLGHDAAPTIVAALPRMSDADACVVRRAMARDRRRRETDIANGSLDWRAWSVASWRAERAWQRAGVTLPWAGRACPTDVVSPRSNTAPVPPAPTPGAVTPSTGAVSAPTASSTTEATQPR